MNLKEIGINTRNWVDLAQDRDYWRTLVNAALNLQVQQTIELVILLFIAIPWSHAFRQAVFNRTTEIGDGRGILTQYMGSVPAEHCEEFDNY